MTLRLLTMLLLLYTRGTERIATVRRRMNDDRGDALSTAAIAVGLVLLAGIVIVILTNKGKTIANNVCTNADPSTCK